MAIKPVDVVLKQKMQGGAGFRSDSEFSGELKRRIHENEIRAKQEKSSNNEEKRTTAARKGVETRLANLKEKFSVLGITAGTEFIFSYGSGPKLFLCKTISILESNKKILAFEVLSANTNWRGASWINLYSQYHLYGITPENHPDFEALKSHVLEKHAEITRPKREAQEKAEAKRKAHLRARAEAEKQKQNFRNQFWDEVKRQGFALGMKVQSPVGPGFIKRFDDEKLQVVMSIIGKSGRKAFQPNELSWLVV